MSLNAAPPVKVLRALKETLDQVDWNDVGLPGGTIRFARRRHAMEEEITPGWALSIRYVSDEPRQSDMEDNYLTSGECVIEMMVVLEIEATIPDEDLAPTDPMYDPTGMGLFTSIAFTALSALKAEDAALRLAADDVVDRGRAADEEAMTPDDGRFEQTLFVLYRVRTDDPSVLLAMGENAS